MQIAYKSFPQSTKCLLLRGKLNRLESRRKYPGISCFLKLSLAISCNFESSWENCYFPDMSWHCFLKKSGHYAFWQNSFYIPCILNDYEKYGKFPLTTSANYNLWYLYIKNIYDIVFVMMCFGTVYCIELVCYIFNISFITDETASLFVIFKTLIC